jgi:hypothetical protein
MPLNYGIFGRCSVDAPSVTTPNGFDCLAKICCATTSSETPVKLVMQIHTNSDRAISRDP